MPLIYHIMALLTFGFIASLILFFVYHQKNQFLKFRYVPIVTASKTPDVKPYQSKIYFLEQMLAYLRKEVDAREVAVERNALVAAEMQYQVAGHHLGSVRKKLSFSSPSLRSNIHSFEDDTSAFSPFAASPIRSGAGGHDATSRASFVTQVQNLSATDLNQTIDHISKFLEEHSPEKNSTTGQKEKSIERRFSALVQEMPSCLRALFLEHADPQTTPTRSAELDSSFPDSLFVLPPFVHSPMRYPQSDDIGDQNRSSEKVKTPDLSPIPIQSEYN